MKISVIIPTLNEELYIDHILSDLEKQTERPAEIIVVDGRSTDDTQRIVNRHKNVILKSVAANAGRQRHLGATVATSDMLIFFDADSRISPTFIEKSLAEMYRKKLDIAIPKYRNYKGVTHWYMNLCEWYINFFFLHMSKKKPYGAGACILVTKALYAITKGFEERYRIEDVPFIREAAKRGTFGIINTEVRCSDRRFKKYGYIRTTLAYIALAIFFLFNLYSLSNYVKYEFGKYKKE